MVLQWKKTSNSRKKSNIDLNRGAEEYQDYLDEIWDLSRDKKFLNSNSNIINLNQFDYKSIKDSSSAMKHFIEHFSVNESWILEEKHFDFISLFSSHGTVAWNVSVHTTRNWKNLTNQFTWRNLQLARVSRANPSHHFRYVSWMWWSRASKMMLEIGRWRRNEEEENVKEVERLFFSTIWRCVGRQ